MVNGPPCPQCGYTLRWLAPQNGWGCDRCQKMFSPQQVQPASAPTPQPSYPAQQPQYGQAPQQHGYAPQGQQGYGGPPPQAYSPQPQGYGGPQGAMPPPPGGGKSKKGLVIGLTIGALAIAGGVIALVLVMRGKSSAAGGSRDDVLRATFAAMSAGDADELVALSGVEAFYGNAIKCKDRKKDDDDEASDERKEWEEEFRDPKKLLERAQKNAAKTVLRTKGVKIEVVEILTKEPKPLKGDEKQSSNKKKKRGEDDDGESTEDEDSDRDRDRDSDREERSEDERDTNTFVMKKGAEVAPGCEVKQTFRFQNVKVKLKITEGDGEPIEYKTKIGLTNIGSGWYLSEPPFLPVGFDALAKDLEPSRDKLCKCTDGKCAEKTAKEIEKEYGRLERLVDGDPFSSDDNDEIPKEKLASLKKIVDEMKSCVSKAKGGAMLAKMTEVKNAMCACKDRACTDKVVKDMSDYAKTQDSSDKPDEETMKQLTDLSKQMTECMMKVMTPDATITSITPAIASADGGTELTINGSGFYSSSPISVYFGTQRGLIVRTESDTAIRVLVPRLLTGGETNVDIVVNMSNGKELRLEKAFTYEQAAEAAVAKLEPAKNLPPSCDKYRQALEQAQTCSKYPASAKTGLAKAWESLLKTDATWNRQSASLKKSITDTCELGAKSMGDALKAMGC